MEKTKRYEKFGWEFRWFRNSNENQIGNDEHKLFHLKYSQYSNSAQETTRPNWQKYISLIKVGPARKLSYLSMSQIVWLATYWNIFWWWERKNQRFIPMYRFTKIVCVISSLCHWFRQNKAVSATLNDSTWMEKIFRNTEIITREKLHDEQNRAGKKVDKKRKCHWKISIFIHSFSAIFEQNETLKHLTNMNWDEFVETLTWSRVVVTFKHSVIFKQC